MSVIFLAAAAGALVRDGESDREILLVKRADERTWLPGYWELPGGRIEADEQPNQALIREYREETGIEISPPGKPYASYVFDELYEKRRMIEIDYLVKPRSEGVLKVEINDESSEYHWATRNDVETLKIDPRMRESIFTAFELSGS